MQITRKFKTVAVDGTISVSKKAVVPVPVSIKSATVLVKQFLTGEKTFHLSINGDVVFKGCGEQGETFTFNPPIKIPFGIPTIAISSWPYDDRITLKGTVTLNLDVG